MNIAFIVDNSITMAQITYNGLSLLEYAKGYIERIIEARDSGLKSTFDSKPERYHLFKSSYSEPLSTYQHNDLHFFCQLKLIQPEIITDIAYVLRKAFSTISKYRILEGSENIMGFTEPFSCSPSQIILITDLGDQQSLIQIKQLILNKQLLNKYDNQFWILRICAPSKRQKISNGQNIKKAIEKDSTSKIMNQICEYLNGQVRYVVRYQHGFQILQSILSGYKHRISFKIKVEPIELNLNVKYLKDSGLRTNPYKSTSPFLKQNQIIVHHQIKNTKIKSRIPFPDKAPRIIQKKNNDFSPPQIETFGYPQYIIDFSKVFEFSMNKYMPFEKIQIQANQIFKEVAQKMKNQKMYFPVYFFHDQFKYILIGLMKITKTHQIAQFFIYLANFVEFSPIFDHVTGAKKFMNRQFQPLLIQYLRKIPLFYQKHLLNILIQKGTKRDYSPKLIQKLTFNDKICRLQSEEFRTLMNKLKINQKSHLEYDADCCPTYSKNFPQYSKNISKYKNVCMINKTFKNLLSNVINLKMDIFNVNKSNLQDQIYRYQYECIPVTKGVEMFKKAQVQGGQQLGNPFKKRRKDSQVFRTVNDDRKITYNFSSSNNKQIILRQGKQNNNEQYKKQAKTDNIIIQNEGMIEQKRQKAEIKSKNIGSQKFEQKMIEQKVIQNNEQQIMINQICNLFSIKKSMKTKLNPMNLTMEMYNKNNNILKNLKF